MRHFQPPLIALFFLVGCMVPASVQSPKLPETTVIQLQPPPLLVEYLTADRSQFTEHVESWRNGLVGYQTYLSGYVQYLTVTYRLSPLDEKPKCPPEPVAPILILDKLPAIPDYATSEEESEVLFEHIEKIRSQVKDYNTALESYRKARELICL